MGDMNAPLSPPDAPVGGETTLGPRAPGTSRGLTSRSRQRPGQAVRQDDRARRGRPGRAQGTVLGVLGPNGAGKTTAVRILATLLRPDAGAARVGGLDVVRDARRSRQIGLTGQYASVDEELTGTENLVLIGRLLDLSRASRRGPGRRSCWSGSTSPRPPTARPRTTPAACAGASTWPPAWSAARRCMYLDEPTTGLDPLQARGHVADGPRPGRRRRRRCC